MTARVFGAVDLGASMGRVMAGVVKDGAVTLRTVHRFSHEAVAQDGALRWRFTDLYHQILTGLRELGRQHPDVESIGIDTWGVDYGLLDGAGTLLAEPVSYRDLRAGPALDRVHRLVGGAAPLFAVNGIQPAPINTIYQLEADRSSPQWTRAEHAMLLPDLLVYWLTGQVGTELTNASTTGLLDSRTGRWSPVALDAIGLGSNFLPPLRQAGNVVGPLLPTILERTGLPHRTVVTTVGSHDTASAVVALPAESRSFGFVSSGTWSVVGLELDHPVVTEDARLAGMSNERGVDDRVLFLRNLSGLWLLQESLRSWSGGGTAYELDALLAAAQALPADGPVIDVDDAELLAPGNMPARINAAVVAGGHRPLEDAPAVTRCVLDSLATAYARALHSAASLAGTRLATIHVVGGGSRNALLCQLTADLSGRPVTAGPVEATALGNVLIQARTHGAATGTLEELRARLAESQPVRLFRPN